MYRRKKKQWYLHSLFFLGSSVKLDIYLLHTASVPLFNTQSLLTAFNWLTIKYFLSRSTILQFWCDLQTLAYTSDLCVPINPFFPVGESLPITSSSSLIHFILPLYQGSTLALCLLTFVPRDVLIISSKNMISVYSTEQKNLIAEPSIQLRFTGVENNKQGGELRSRRSPWDYCSKEIWYDYRKQ